MKPTSGLRLDLVLRRLTPFLITAGLVLIGVLPVHIPAYGPVAPLLPLMAIYHWSLYRPELMPASAVFLLGLMVDALTGTPIGVIAGVFVVIRGVVESQQRFFIGKSFAIVWFGFALVLAGALAVSWLLVSAFHVTIIAPGALAFQFALTLGGFPVLSWLLLRWQQAVLKQA